MEYGRLCLVLGICGLLCSLVEAQAPAQPREEAQVVELAAAGENSQADSADTQQVTRKARQYFGPPPPPFFGPPLPPPPPYYGGGFNGFGGGGYGGFGGGYNFQRTRVVTRTRYRGGFGGFGGGAYYG